MQFDVKEGVDSVGKTSKFDGIHTSFFKILPFWSLKNNICSDSNKFIRSDEKVTKLFFE